MSNVQGYQGKWYHGTAGSPAATQILNLTDATYNLDHDSGNTTVRGDGDSHPIETETATVIKVAALDITMVQDTSDTTFNALEAAAAAGTAIAVKNKAHSTGKGFDGDVYVKSERGEPLRGEATIKFNFRPTKDGGRTPQLNVV